MYCITALMYVYKINKFRVKRNRQKKKKMQAIRTYTQNGYSLTVRPAL